VLFVRRGIWGASGDRRVEGRAGLTLAAARVNEACDDPMARKHRDVMRILIADIVSGVRPAGDMLPREVDLAAEFEGQPRRRARDDSRDGGAAG
jgi:hypothetical protein